MNLTRLTGVTVMGDEYPILSEFITSCQSSESFQESFRVVLNTTH